MHSSADMGSPRFVECQKHAAHAAHAVHARDATALSAHDTAAGYFGLMCTLGSDALASADVK